MVKMYRDKNGNLYQGDMAIGDREATQEEIEAYKVSVELTKTKAEALAYLASTDWYIIRFADSGVEVPQEVKDKRAEARLKL